MNKYKVKATKVDEAVSIYISESTLNTMKEIHAFVSNIDNATTVVKLPYSLEPQKEDEYWGSFSFSANESKYLSGNGEYHFDIEKIFNIEDDYLSNLLDRLVEVSCESGALDVEIQLGLDENYPSDLAVMKNERVKLGKESSRIYSRILELYER